MTYDEINTTLMTTEQIDNLLIKNKNKLIEELSIQIEKMLVGYPACQQTTGKGDLQFIYISFLRSSVMDSFPFYRIDFYDERQFQDLVEYCGHWNIAAVADVIYNTRPKPKKGVSSINLDWEIAIENVWAEEFEIMHNRLAPMVSEITRQALSNHRDRLDRVKIWFGEYLGNQQYVEY